MHVKWGALGISVQAPSFRKIERSDDTMTLDMTLVINDLETYCGEHTEEQNLVGTFV